MNFLLSILALVIGFLVAVFATRRLIPLLKRIKLGQEIREEGPQSHLQKQGTPTMGGVVFLPAVAFATFIGNGINRYSVFLVLCATLFGLIGFLDDGLKLLHHRSLGLRAWQKIAGQLIVVVIVLAVGIGMVDLLPHFWVPGFQLTLNNAAFYVAVMFIVLIGTTNAANLTDGLDGLLSGTSVIIAIGFFVISTWFLLPAGMVFSAALVGTLLGFFYFNRHPAAIFMGDTGSFFVGGAMAGLAMLTKTELLLPLLCLIYVLEALSVMIQVAVFKKTGKRVFRMSPLHHHFELGGLKEEQVLYLFAIITGISVLLALLVVHGADPALLQQLRR